MNDKMVEYIRTKAQDPQWAYLMKELFPLMMSYTPGGINYNLNRPASVRAQNWVDIHMKLTAFCEMLGVNYIGLNRPMASDAIDRANDLSVSGNLRKLRNQWKKVMQVLSWGYADPLWRRADGRDPDMWAAEWRVLRAEMRKNYPERFKEEEVAC